MDKKYQVFVSSTYKDLVKERQVAIQTLLESNFIPVGMELFPASDDQQWKLIQRLITNCDYLIVIVAGKYGSLAPDGKSYTQKEYEFAISKGIPVLAFYHSNPTMLPAGACETDSELILKLNNFRNLIKEKMARPWETADQLGRSISMSIQHSVANIPRPGWLKIDKLIATNRSEMWKHWNEAAKNTKSKLSAITMSIGPKSEDEVECQLCEDFFSTIEKMKFVDIRLLASDRSLKNHEKYNSLCRRQEIGFEVRIHVENDSEELTFRYQVVDEELIVLNIPSIEEDAQTEMCISFKNDKVGKKLQQEFDILWEKSIPFEEYFFKSLFEKKLDRVYPIHHYLIDFLKIEKRYANKLLNYGQDKNIIIVDNNTFYKNPSFIF